MSGLAGNAKNDIYLGPDGNLAWNVGVEAVADDCKTAMQAQLGEMVLALQDGLPTDATIWSRWSPLQFEAAARRTLLAVPNVVAVTFFELTRQGDVATYAATVQTAFGQTTVQGIING